MWRRYSLEGALTNVINYQFFIRAEVAPTL
jgi:hypothetical protein